MRYAVGLIGFVVIVIFISLVWRVASNRYSLPLPAFLKGMVALDNPFARQHRAAVIIDQLNVEPGMVVIDVGCGPGRLTVPLAKQVEPDGRVVAIDMQQRMLDAVRKKARARQLRTIDCVRVSMGTGEIDRHVPPSSADRAVLVTVLGEITDRKAAFKELFNALKPGGMLSVTETVFDPHYQRRDDVIALAVQTGFIERDTFGHRLAYTVHFTKAESSSY